MSLIDWINKILNGFKVFHICRWYKDLRHFITLFLFLSFYVNFFLFFSVPNKAFIH